MYGGNLYLDLRHSGISKKITKSFLLGLSITIHKTKANIFAQPSSRAFTEYTHCVRPSLAFHIKAVPVHKGGFSTPVKKLLFLLKIWRCQGCIVYRVYTVIQVVFLFCSGDIEILSQAKDVSKPVQVFSYGKLSVIPIPAFLQSSIFHANVCACMGCDSAIWCDDTAVHVCGAGVDRCWLAMSRVWVWAN